MTQISSLIQFTAGQKAVAADVNSNFETLRESNNEIDSTLENLNGAIQTPLAVSITSLGGVLTLPTGNSASNIFAASGQEGISSITGWSNGIALIRWNSNRALICSSSLILQNSSNRFVKIGDVSIFEFNSGITREINYFPATSPANPTVYYPAYVPYSVASGMQVSGNAGFLSSAGSTSVLLSAITPLQSCYPNGTLETVSTNMTISGLTKCSGYVSSITSSGTTATVTTSVAHNLQTGDIITISGSTIYYSGTSSYYNGTFTVTVTSSNQFTYVMGGTATSPSTGALSYSITYTLIKELDSYSVSSLTRNGTTITVATSIPTQLKTGDSVTIGGCAQTDYNGTFTVTVTGSSSFTYTVASSMDLTALGTITASIGLRSVYAVSYNTVTESLSAPTGGNSGDYWLCYGIKPYASYKNVSGTWIPVQFVKLGQVTISSGTMATPVCYPFNQNPFLYNKNNGTSISANTIYKSSTNGFLFVQYSASSSNAGVSCGLTVYSDANPVPSTAVFGESLGVGGTSWSYGSFSGWIPINKGNYYEAVTSLSSGTSSSFSGYFYPTLN